MSTAETSSALLRRAADRLDELAAAAPAGPWRDVQNGWCIRSEPTAERSTWATVTDAPYPGASPWITTLSPLVAPHLSSWLRAEATLLDGPIQQDVNAGHVRIESPPVALPVSPALALARTILGEES